MHTDTPHHGIGATEYMMLEDAVIDGVVIANPNSAEDLLSHLEQIHRCNTSDKPSQVVGIDTEFNASSQAGRDRWPILRLIGLCYVNSDGRVVMISVNMKVVSMMDPRNMSRVNNQLRDLFVSRQGRMAAFNFTRDKQALE
jgi:hypothetical protein